MAASRTLIVSDLHLGSAHCQVRNFSLFLDSLEPGTRLVLNGDSIDDPRHPLSAEAACVLRRLLPGNTALDVVWIEGNHDCAETLKRQWNLDSHPQYRLSRPFDILILHGVCFDTVGTRLRHGVRLFRGLHRLRGRLGLTSIHFAEYAKRWQLVYRLMRRTVRKNAVRHARAERAEMVVCGHVHQAEDSMVDQIRYINTGAWTEKENHCLEITEQGVALRRWNMP